MTFVAFTSFIETLTSIFFSLLLIYTTTVIIGWDKVDFNSACAVSSFSTYAISLFKIAKITNTKMLTKKIQNGDIAIQ